MSDQEMAHQEHKGTLMISNIVVKGYLCVKIGDKFSIRKIKGSCKPTHEKEMVMRNAIL